MTRFHPPEQLFGPPQLPRSFFRLYTNLFTIPEIMLCKCQIFSAVWSPRAVLLLFGTESPQTLVAGHVSRGQAASLCLCQN